MEHCLNRRTILPLVIGKDGPAVTFRAFAFFNLINLLFSCLVVKETKNKTLEEMEQLFIARH